MANFDQAFQYLMQWEDEGLTGKITEDDGGRTRFGIAQRFHPELVAIGFFDYLPTAEALMMARDTYERGDWRLMNGAGMSWQPLANKMLSIGVNLGMVRVIRWAQECAEVHVDGQVGPETLAAWNAKSTEVLRCLSLDAEAHYRQRADEKPELKANLKGWLRRAQDSAVMKETA